MNSVQLIGRLTRDPDVRYTSESQMAVARFSIAINRPPRRNAAPGENENQADFPNIVCFGRTAENCERFLKKGRLVGIQGRLQTGSYINKDGVKVYTTDVIANNVEFLEWGDRNERGQNDFQQGGYGQAPQAPAQGGFDQNQRAPAQGGQGSFAGDQGAQGAGNNQPQAGAAPAGFQTIDDDDIPF